MDSILSHKVLYKHHLVWTKYLPPKKIKKTHKAESFGREVSTKMSAKCNFMYHDTSFHGANTQKLRVIEMIKCLEMFFLKVLIMIYVQRVPSGSLIGMILA